MKRFYLFLFFLIAFGFSCFSQQSTIVLKPGPDEGKDANVLSRNPATNYGNSHLFKADAWTYSGEFYIDRIFLDFNLDTIVDVDNLISAKLNLYYHYLNVGQDIEQTQYGDNFSVIRRVITPWEEDKITWNNQPQATEEDQLILPPSTNLRQDFLGINVTTLVKDILNKPDSSFGFMIKIYKEETYRRIAFASSDHPDPDKWPELVLEVNCDSLTTAGFDKSIENGMYRFTDTSHNASSWYWDFGDGYFSTVQNPMHAFFVDDTVQVCLTVTGGCGTDTYCQTFKPSLTSVNQNLFENELYLYPNPAANRVFIRSKGIKPSHLAADIYNALGMIISHIDFNNADGEKSFDVSGLSSGVYYVHLKSGKFISVKKLIVQK